METHVTSQNDLPVQNSLQIFKTDIKVVSNTFHQTKGTSHKSGHIDRGRSKN